MRRVLIVVFIFIQVTFSLAQNAKVEEARKLYPKSGTNKEVCKKLYDMLAQIDEKNQNLLLGYKGAVMAEMAKHEKDAPKKLKFFKEGKRKLDESILNDLENIELRFLRLSIQLHTPSALRYNGNISSDKEFIVQNIEKVKNENLKKSISEFMATLDSMPVSPPK